ncbi:TonB-dependent siderophore receptor [Oxalobacteraceae bacterium]|nr:TonB-dependent siderophore receptor [Oxalobacteraceae bacterium]
MSTPRFAVSALTLAVLNTLPAAALAQDTPQQNQVLVSASRIAPDRASVAGFSEQSLLQTPASVSVLTSQQMVDRDIRSTTDAARYDASISDAYNAVGYAEQFSIRGFKLDNGSSYRKDGIAISADTQIPLENKERLEVLKGLSGLQAGVAAPGGIVNYVTKRPTKGNVRSVILEERERGTLYGAVDLGGRFEDSRFGYRVNVAAERLRSYIKGADGNRKFASAAFDWQISPRALLEIDADYQKKSQISATGFQLLGGTTLPNIPADTMLSGQPWAQPVQTTSSNLGVRFEYLLANDWRASVNMNQHQFKRDDYTAFPYGCGAENLYPGYCSNGDYDVYDYKSLGEKKSPFGAQALLQGKFATGALRHELSTGASFHKDSEKWGDYQYDYAGTSNIYHPVIVPNVPGSSAPVVEHRRTYERSLFVQDIVGLNAQFKLHAGARYAQIKREELVDSAPNAKTDQGFWLPNVALVYSPLANVSLYGSVSQGLQYGGIAPKGSSNEKRALDANKSKQLELGAKADITPGLSASATLFQIRQGLEYVNEVNTFVRNGVQQHRGLELALQGQATRDLVVGVTATALNTRQSGTGRDDIDGKRVTDVAAFKSSVYADYAVAAVKGLKLNANWQYSGKKAFDVTNSVMVPGYHVVNLGASYATRIAGTATTFRAHLDNAFDKFYWRDVTPDLGGYLMPGASRTFRVSAQFDL